MFTSYHFSPAWGPFLNSLAEANIVVPSMALDAALVNSLESPDVSFANVLGENAFAKPRGECSIKNGSVLANWNLGNGFIA